MNKMREEKQKFQLTIDQTNRFIMLIFQLAILCWGTAKGINSKSHFDKARVISHSNSTLKPQGLFLIDLPMHCTAVEGDEPVITEFEMNSSHLEFEFGI